MATIVTRAGKGSALTHTEMDSNSNNLNNDKAELSGSTFTGTVNLTSLFQINGTTVTPTAAELNYVDGVTSSIQTQINSTYKLGGTDVAIADGGTGSSTTSGARSNLGLGAVSLLEDIDGSSMRTAVPGSRLVHIMSSNSTMVTVPTKISESSVPYSGTFTIRLFGHSSGGQTGAVRVYKNGSAFGTNRTTNSYVYVSWDENLVFAAGDLIQIYCDAGSGNDPMYGYLYVYEAESNPSTFISQVV